MYPAHPVCRLLPAAHGVWAAKTAANRLAKLPRFLQRGEVSIAPRATPWKACKSPDHGSRLGEKRQRHHGNVVGREAAQLDSPGQRPGTKAEATQHKAQRAVTALAPRVTPRWALEPRHGNPIPQASGLGCRVWPRWGRGAVRVPQTQRPPNATAPRGKSGPSARSGSRPAEQKRYQKIASFWQPTLRGCESIDCTLARPQSVGCVKRTMHDGLWCVSRTLQKFTASPCAAFFRRHTECAGCNSGYL